MSINTNYYFVGTVVLREKFSLKPVDDVGVARTSLYKTGFECKALAGLLTLNV